MLPQRMWEIPHTDSRLHRGCGKFPTQRSASAEDVWNPPHALPSLCLTSHRTASVSFPLPESGGKDKTMKMNMMMGQNVAGSNVAGINVAGQGFMPGAVAINGGVGVMEIRKPTAL